MEYNKSAFDSFFTIDRPSCSLHERTNLVPYSEEIDHLRPRTPPHNEPHVRTRNSQRSLPSAGRWSKGNDGSASQIGTTTPSLRAHAHASGAGLSGLGAGGNAVVSVPSGSELLSGAQANVIFGGQQSAGPANGAIANVHVGPSGLGRKARRAG
jgi:mRNA (2'-O-methyladenosine-N6-)-methyltransferase